MDESKSDRVILELPVYSMTTAQGGKQEEKF